jgi:hypothetical protein
MAGDWIKVETSTPDKPEIFRMSAVLGIDVDSVLGKCIRFWAWADANTEDGIVDAKTSTGVDALMLQIDRMCSHQGFSNALFSVGWLEFSTDRTSVIIPSFAYHNGDSAKKRAAKSKRQQKWRDGKRQKDQGENVDAKTSTDVDATAYPREEKRRDIKRNGDFSEKPSFDEFWAVVSKRWHGSPGNKKEAGVEFNKIKPSQDEVALMLRANQTQFDAAMALVSEDKFAPNFKHVVRWLKYRGWEQDEKPTASVHPFTKNPNYPGLVARAQKCGHAVEYDTGKELVWITGDGAVA